MVTVWASGAWSTLGTFARAPAVRTSSTRAPPTRFCNGDGRRRVEALVRLSRELDELLGGFLGGFTREHGGTPVSAGPRAAAALPRQAKRPLAEAWYTAAADALSC